MKRLIIIPIFLLLSFHNSAAEPIQSSVGHVYWGLGPNFGLLGNVRLGFGSVEFGILQNAGFGVAYIYRTMSPLFFQIGAVGTSGGGGIVGGGGMEWNTSSWFRWRSDITVTTDKAYQTEGYVSFGGVFIL